MSVFRADFTIVEDNRFHYLYNMKKSEIPGTWLERHIDLHEHDDPIAEKENSITHAIGAVLSLFYIVVVLVIRESFAKPETSWGMLIYGLSLVVLYSSSAIYHALPRNDGKRIFRFLDHANIYILIAGTYTPILLYIGSQRAQLVLIVVWMVALAGILFSLLFWNKLKALHVILYLAMGWMIILFWSDIVPFLPKGLLPWVISAGITYSAGVAFYANKKLPHNHAIWHIFCITASTLFCVGFILYLTS
jgi:hemolysin III